MILLTPEGDVWENDFSVVKLFAFYFKNLFPETKLEAQWNEFILAGRKKADSLNFSFEEEPKAHILVELTLQEHVQFILQSLLNVQSEGSVVLLSYIAKQREYLRKEINFLQNKIQSNLKYLKLLKESEIFDSPVKINFGEQEIFIPVQNFVDQLEFYEAIEEVENELQKIKLDAQTYSTFLETDKKKLEILNSNEFENVLKDLLRCQSKLRNLDSKDQIIDELRSSAESLFLCLRGAWVSWNIRYRSFLAELSSEVDTLETRKLELTSLKGKFELSETTVCGLDRILHLEKNLIIAVEEIQQQHKFHLLVSQCQAEFNKAMKDLKRIETNRRKRAAKESWKWPKCFKFLVEEAEVPTVKKENLDPIIKFQDLIQMSLT
eukprot:GHVP01059718.1.p1 GENE.GHVP01059718.1~~GHVP01059718.1.p1  ORF type:complete len:379 (+),score=99.17 GHVP01059718.1:1556-2692(+)